MISKTVSNVIKIVLCFATPSIPIILIAWFAEGMEIAVAALTFFIIISAIIHKLSGRIILRWYNTQKISHSESPSSHSVIEELASKAQVCKPDLHIFESSTPTIFTVGAGKKTSIVVSTKLINIFDKMELEALFAHEIGHIKNKDTSLNTIVALFAGTLAAFSTAAMWGLMLIGAGQEYNPAPRLIRFLAMGLVAPPAALFVQTTIKGMREYEADEIGVNLTEKPHILAQTLERLERYIKMHPAEHFNPGHAHMFSINPLRIEELYDVHLSLFDTHSNVQHRINNLMDLNNYIIEDNSRLKGE